MVIFHGYVGLPEGNHNYQNWLVVWNMAFIGNVIIPTDEHIFQRGWYTTNQIFMGQYWDPMGFDGMRYKHQVRVFGLSPSASVQWW
jgi:hypothetical protein